MSTISQDKIASLEIALPPLKEQSEVAEYINASRKKIEVSISKAEKQIELLHEYRTALISEAVTGKIDVREAV
jgi:restriction endonuclease S subunit